LIELHGRFLAVHPAVSIRIERNTDAQGGSAYKLALGQITGIFKCRRR